MTKLTATDIKGIIEKKGSNAFDVIIEVPKNIFSYSPKEQADIIQTEILGFTISANIVRSTMLVGPSPKGYLIKIKASLEFSDAALSEIEGMAGKVLEYLKSAVKVTSVLNVADCQNLVEQGINKLVFEVPHYFEISDVPEMLMDRTTAGIKFRKIKTYPTNLQTKSGYKAILVIIEDFAERVNQTVQINQLTEDAYAKLDIPAEPRSEPLNSMDLEEIAQEMISEMDEDEFIEEEPTEVFFTFSYLVEAEFEELESKDETEFLEYICSLIVDPSDISYHDVEDLETKVVGFNAGTNKLIVHAEGGFRLEVY